MMILGCPVVDNHDLTHKLFESLKETVTDPENFTFVIIDNDSEKRYRQQDFQAVFHVKVIRNSTNRGYYYPLQQLQKLFPEAEYFGLCHNDITIYEKSWNERIIKEFEFDEKLGCIGFCGSWMIAANGGRGYGTVCNFKGENGQTQVISGGRISDRKPSVSLDSLFMMFRKEAIPALKIDEDIALCHFYDRIWTLREWAAGWHVIVLGIEVDHWGGRTSCSPKYNEDAKKWCKKRGIPVIDDNGDLSVYKEAEVRYLREFSVYMPSFVDDNYNVRLYS